MSGLRTGIANPASPDWVTAKRQIKVGLLADEGLTIVEIADQLGLNRNRVRADMRAMGYDVAMCDHGHGYRCSDGRPTYKRQTPECSICRSAKYRARVVA